MSTQPPHDNGPREWFPGVHTGPRVAISLSANDIETIREMVDDDYPTMTRDQAAALLRDLDVRVGALEELGQLDRHDPNKRRVVPLLPEEFRTLRLAYERYAAARRSATIGRVAAMFIDLDRRIGAAQIRMMGSGEMDIPAQRHHGGDVYPATILEELEATVLDDEPDAEPGETTARAGRRPRRLWRRWF